MLLHELRGVPIEVVHGNVLDAAAGVPRNEGIACLVDAEEQLQHGNDRHKRKHVENGRKDVEKQCAYHIPLVGEQVVAHDAEKLSHR